MDFHVRVEPTYPRLGYVCVVEDRGVVLHCGAGVEVRGNRFSDGVWDGEYAVDPTRASFVCGSVGIVREHSVEVFVSQSPADRVFYFQLASGATLFSNSLALILMESGQEMDPNYVSYRSEAMSSEVGISMAPRTVHLRSGRRMGIALNEVITFSSEGVRTAARPPQPAFDAFADYREHLAGAVQRVRRNAQDPARAHPLRPLPTISAGYDSSVVAVLAAEAGVHEALTMLRYDPNRPGELVDYPEAVAEALGLTLIGVQRDTWRGDTDLPDALIAAASVTFMDVVMLALTEHVNETLLIVGNHGDHVWGSANFRPVDDIHHLTAAISGRGLAEHRLDLGYVVFALPFIGSTAQRSIAKITHAAEMAPWTVDGEYDRPIARRIAEEAGVPRGSFATRKFAGSARVGSSRTRYLGRDRLTRRHELLEVMTPIGADSFLDFIEDLENQGLGLANRRVQMLLGVGPRLSWVYQKMLALNFRIGRRFHVHGVRTILPRRAQLMLGLKTRINPDYTYLWPHWGVHILQERYRPDRPPIADAPSTGFDVERTPGTSQPG